MIYQRICSGLPKAPLLLPPFQLLFRTSRQQISFRSSPRHSPPTFCSRFAVCFTDVSSRTGCTHPEARQPPRKLPKPPSQPLRSKLPSHPPLPKAPRPRLKRRQSEASNLRRRLRQRQFILSRQTKKNLTRTKLSSWKPKWCQSLSGTTRQAEERPFRSLLKANVDARAQHDLLPRTKKRNYARTRTTHHAPLTTRTHTHTRQDKSTNYNLKKGKHTFLKIYCI